MREINESIEALEKWNKSDHARWITLYLGATDKTMWWAIYHTDQRIRGYGIDPAPTIREALSNLCDELELGGSDEQAD